MEYTLIFFVNGFFIVIIFGLFLIYRHAKKRELNAVDTGFFVIELIRYGIYSLLLVSLLIGIEIALISFLIAVNTSILTLAFLLVPFVLFSGVYCGRYYAKKTSSKIFGFLVGLFAIFTLMLPPFLLWLMGAGLGSPGRPFRSRGKFLKAGSMNRNDWNTDVQINAEVLDAGTRKKLTNAWLEIAATEHASVATFSKLSLQLMALGAPPELLKTCQQAAMDEIEHARCCYSLASVYAGQTLGPTPFTELNGIQLEKITLEQLAIESLQDGCLMEGYFSAALYVAAEQAIDPALKTSLMNMAEDEARHAKLAWDILDWSLKSSTEIEAKIQNSLVNLPKALPIKHYDELALTTFEQQGFLSKKRQDDLYHSLLNSVTRRIVFGFQDFGLEMPIVQAPPNVIANKV